MYLRICLVKILLLHYLARAALAQLRGCWPLPIAIGYWPGWKQELDLHSEKIQCTAYLSYREG